MTFDIRSELKLWGPESHGPSNVTLPEAEDYCRRLARSHYENFPVVSWLLPRRLHQHFFNVYAFCRWADDLGDEIASPDESLNLLAWWNERLHACQQEDSRHPVFAALARTICEFDIPVSLFADLISAFEQDQQVSQYNTFGELQEYCQRSANPVGRIVLHLVRQAADDNCALSDAVCTGLQLANFWQDVGRDLDLGRIYLPLEDRMRYGYSDAELRSRVTNRPFEELMAFQVERARGFLKEGLPLASRLPLRIQVDIDLFARGGLRILDRIERIHYRVWDRRPEVTKRDVAGLFFGSLMRALCRTPSFLR